MQLRQSHKGLRQQDASDRVSDRMLEGSRIRGKGRKTRERGRVKEILKRFAAREVQLICILEESPASSSRDHRVGGQIKVG